MGRAYYYKAGEGGKYVGDKCWEELANAIVAMTARDYRIALKRKARLVPGTKKIDGAIVDCDRVIAECEIFFSCVNGTVLTKLDTELLMRQIQRMAKKELEEEQRARDFIKHKREAKNG